MQSKAFRSSVIVVGVLAVALVSFSAGVAVGLRKARFSYAWGENYERHFLGGERGRMSGGMMGVPDGDGFRNPHGVSGTVVAVAGDVLMVKGLDDQESSVRLIDETLIMKQRARIAVSDIQQGDTVKIVGKPAEDGVVMADFVRVFGRDDVQPMSGRGGRGR
ncbi:MAG: hypothetical protein QG664_250 [Patescibacteria group bacterium]|nr:hypothetical protein [Patescibacteria group bacterium]